MKKITMIGVGYVGLVTGACFAEMGQKVTCLDIDPQKIANLKEGVIPIYEPGLEEIVHRNQKAHRLSFTTDYASALADPSFIFIAVDTPTQEDGQANLDAVVAVAKSIGQHLQKEAIILTKSTVPPNTTFLVQEVIQQHLQKPVTFHVANNPEFLKEGAAIQDFMKPDRVVVGAQTPSVHEAIKKLYQPFMLSHERFLAMDIISSEMTKYAANAMLATRISFMNEMAQMAEAFGADIQKVREGIGSDQRIGLSFLYPGVGYGGSCLPKDVLALKSQANALGVQTPLLHAVEKVNQTQKELLVEKVLAHFDGNVEGKTFALWGLSFKPYTDDMREAASLTVIKRLLQLGASLRLYDPVAMTNATKWIADHPQIHWMPTELAAAKGADGILLLTEWKQFRFLDMKEVLDTMNGSALFDGRNQYDPKEMEEMGFCYYGIGRGRTKKFVTAAV